MAVPFTVKQVRTLYDTETKDIPYYNAIMVHLLTLEDTRDSHYQPLIPKTIQYIKDNVYHIDTGEYYVVQGTSTPMYKYTKEEIEYNLYICYMPPLSC